MKVCVWGGGKGDGVLFASHLQASQLDETEECFPSQFCPLTWLHPHVANGSALPEVWADISV